MELDQQLHRLHDSLNRLFDGGNRSVGGIAAGSTSNAASSINDAASSVNDAASHDDAVASTTGAGTPSSDGDGGNSRIITVVNPNYNPARSREDESSVSGTRDASTT